MRFVVISILDALEASSTGSITLYSEPSRQLLGAHQPLQPLHPRRNVRQGLMLPHLLEQLRAQAALGVPPKHERVGMARRLSGEPLGPLRLLVLEQVLDDREAGAGVRDEARDVCGVFQRIEEGGDLALVGPSAGNESLPGGLVQLVEDLLSAWSRRGQAAERQEEGREQERDVRADQQAASSRPQRCCSPIPRGTWRRPCRPLPRGTATCRPSHTSSRAAVSRRRSCAERPCMPLQLLTYSAMAHESVMYSPSATLIVGTVTLSLPVSLARSVRMRSNDRLADVTFTPRMLRSA